jgi:futalosine hydrolase
MSMITDICDMHVLLVSATAGEIQPATDHIRASASKNHLPEISILITGVGLVPTTVMLMQQLCSRRPDLIIQAGIAGSFSAGMSGEVVVVQEDCFADLGVLEEGTFRSVFDLGLADRDNSPYRNGYLVNPYTELLSLPGLRQVRGISVHTITTARDTIRRYQEKEGAVVESMEGAALHYVGLVEKIPFIQFRAISNEVGERDKTKWDIRGAVASLNESIIAFLNQLTHYVGNRDRV